MCTLRALAEADTDVTGSHRCTAPHLQAPIDFNQYLGIQRAGIACLQLPQQRVREYAAVWRQRAAALVPVLRRFGWKLPEPKACKPGHCALRPGVEGRWKALAMVEGVAVMQLQ